MNSIILTEYSDKLPEEVQDLLLGFSSPENLGLLIALTEHGKMSFNEMKQKFKLNSSSLTHRLNILQNGNLIKNFYEKTDGRGFSYYNVTDVFEQILDSVYEILHSPILMKEIESTSTISTITPFITNEPLLHEFNISKPTENPITTTENTRPVSISGTCRVYAAQRYFTKEHTKEYEDLLA